MHWARLKHLSTQLPSLSLLDDILEMRLKGDRLGPSWFGFSAVCSRPSHALFLNLSFPC